MRTTKVDRMISDEDHKMSAVTGYFGIPGSSRGSFTVHIVAVSGPLCGWRPRKEMEFQWCAGGIKWDFVECDRCKRAVKNFSHRT